MTITWKMVLGLVYGFLTVPLVIGGIAIVVSAFMGSGWLYTKMAVNSADYWTGLWIFVGLAVLGLTISIRIES